MLELNVFFITTYVQRLMANKIILFQNRHLKKVRLDCLRVHFLSNVSRELYVIKYLITQLRQ